MRALQLTATIQSASGIKSKNDKAGEKGFRWDANIPHPLYRSPPGLAVGGGWGVYRYVGAHMHNTDSRAQHTQMDPFRDVNDFLSP